MRISDWSSDVCSSDLLEGYMAKIENYCQNELHRQVTVHGYLIGAMPDVKTVADDEILLVNRMKKAGPDTAWKVVGLRSLLEMAQDSHASVISSLEEDMKRDEAELERGKAPAALGANARSEEHTSELQSLMRISYA